MNSHNVAAAVTAVEFFGIRHHSPVAASIVEKHIAEQRPAAVLIEGPAEFNNRLWELNLNHTLPLMIYSWAPAFPDAPPDSPEASVRSGSYFPLSSYSPEWTAMSAAHAAGVRWQFIDLPFYALVDNQTEGELAEVADEDDESASGEDTRSAAVAALKAKLQVDDLNAVTDELTDVWPDLSYEQYTERMEMLGRLLRDESANTLRREEYMAQQIRQVLAEVGGPVLVVCGASHIDGLRNRLGEVVPETTTPLWSKPDDDRYGTALTPTSCVALDALRGYGAGQPNPGFYAEVYADRQRGRFDTTERLLRELIEQLRQENQLVSVADAIVVMTAAKALAALRGHPHMWRSDLLDALTTSLVKDERGTEHPLIARIHELLRGRDVGKLAPDAPRPPLTVELHTALTSHNLLPTPDERTVKLDVTRQNPASQLLHSLLVLEVSGFKLLRDATFDGTETWQLQWSPQFETDLVEVARFGASRTEAVNNRILAALSKETDAPDTAAELLLTAVQCGVLDTGHKVRSTCQNLLESSQSLLRLGAALRVLVRLHRFGDLFGGGIDADDLITSGFSRLCALIDGLPPQNEDFAEEFIFAIQAGVQVTERCDDLPIPVHYWSQVLSYQAENDEQPSAIRGASTAALWLGGHTTGDDLTEKLQLVVPASALGDFVLGLLQVARELATRRPEFMQALDSLIVAMPGLDFLESLPGMRRAFSAYPPRERAAMTRQLLGDVEGDVFQTLTASENSLAEVVAMESRVLRRLDSLLGVKF